MSVITRTIRRASIRRGLRGQSSFWKALFLLTGGRKLLGRAGVARGLVGQNPVWRGLLAADVLRRTLQSAVATQPEVVTVAKLEPGDVLRIEAIDPGTLPSAERRRDKR